MPHTDLAYRMRAIVEEAIAVILRLETRKVDPVDPDPIDPVTSDLPLTVTTLVSGITQTTALVDSFIKSFGNSGSLTDLGVCWATTPNPVYEAGGNFINQGLAPSFVNELTGLLPDSTYYVRTFADNKFGRSYSNQLEFRTLAKGGDPVDPPAETAVQRLKISDNKHYLVTEDGEPFFWLGDTTWQLFIRLTLPEIEHYFDNRIAKGFNVIQAVIPGIFHDPRTGDPVQTAGSNRAGQLPYLNNNPATPNEDYFQFVDQVIQLALSKGLYLALLPTWGTQVSPWWYTYLGITPIFNEVNAFTYGKFLSNRYKAFPNIIWMLGGDVPAQFHEGDLPFSVGIGDYLDWRPIWRSMVVGIKTNMSDALLTFHSAGGLWSPNYVREEPWLDINTFQSGHTKDIPSYSWVIPDWDFPKPVLNSEPCYDQAIDGDHPSTRFGESDIRKQLYWSTFAGCCGFTYGNLNVFQFYSSDVKPWISANMFWPEAMNQPAAGQAGYLKRLMQARGGLQRVHNDELVTEGQEEGPSHIVVSTSPGGYILAYLPIGKLIKVDVRSINSKTLWFCWFDPRTGDATARSTINNEGFNSFTTPSPEDWVLVIEFPYWYEKL